MGFKPKSINRGTNLTHGAHQSGATEDDRERSFIETKRLCYDKKFPHAEDYKLWCDIARAGGILNALPIVEYDYRIYAQQKTQQYREEMEHETKLIRKEMKDYVLQCLQNINS